MIVPREAAQPLCGTLLVQSLQVAVHCPLNLTNRVSPFWGQQMALRMHDQSSDNHAGGSPVTKNHLMTVLSEWHETVRLYSGVHRTPLFSPQKPPHKPNTTNKRKQTVGHLSNQWQIRMDPWTDCITPCLEETKDIPQDAAG